MDPVAQNKKQPYQQIWNSKFGHCYVLFIVLQNFVYEAKL